LTCSLATVNIVPMRDYSLAELAALTGLSTRTIRYYVAQGLIPAPGREGRATRYPETTLARLRLICSLRDAHQPLAEIRRRLDELSDEEVLALSAAPPAPPAPPSPGSALEFVRRLLGADRPAMQPDDHALQQLTFHAPSLPPAASGPAPDDLPPALHRRSAASEIAPPLTPSSKPTPSVGDRSQWERIVVGPDIELHVRRPLSKPANRTVERLIAFARQLQEEQDR
jgi:DNA-binding transcriptional MerR regulator